VKGLSTFESREECAHGTRVVRRCVVVALVAVLATVLFWAQRTYALDEDGPGFLRTVSAVNEHIAYHHVGYLEIARVFKRLVFDGAAYPALLFTSALCGGLGLAGFVALVLREGRRRDAWLLGAALACSPALWLQSTRVELHSAQFLGCVVLLGLASLCVGAPRPVRALLVAIGCAAALPMHATNVLLVPGAVWIAARRERGERRFELGTALWCVGGAAAGTWVGIAANSVGRGAATSVFFGDATALVATFFSGASFDFAVNELLLPWFPVLAAALVLLVTGRRGHAGAQPFLAAALPGLVFFLVFGVPTSGGYFMGVLAALGIAAAATGTARRTDEGARVRLFVNALVVLLVALGTWRALAVTHSAQRLALERISQERAARLVELLPTGGWLICVEAHRQSGAGRDALRIESDLSEGIGAAIANGIAPAELKARLWESIERTAADGLTIVISENWRPLVAFEPRLEPYMLAVIAAVEERFDLAPLARPEGNYLVGTPRATNAR